MGFTAAEKLLGRRAGRDVKAGEVVTVPVDAILTNDASGPLSIDYFGKMGVEQIAHPERIVAIIDHYVPCPNSRVASLQQMLYSFRDRYGIRLVEAGDGIAHQVFDELGYVRPGAIIIGGDSHTTTHGYLGSFAIGVGASDLASAMITGELWMKVPQSIRIELKGELRKDVTGKDVALYLLSRLGANGANYMALEFTGSGIGSLSMNDRKTICNLAAECCAKCAIMPLDEKAESYCRERGLEGERVTADEDAQYFSRLEIDLGSIERMVAKPSRADIAVPASEISGTEFDMVVIGTCTNGRIEDFEVFDRIASEHEGPFATETLVIPASRKTLEAMIEKGILSRLVAKGAMVLPPGCGPCCGSSPGTPRDGMNVLSTANRNFLGRMGNTKASIYLSSPITAAIAACTGRL